MPVVSPRSILVKRLQKSYETIKKCCVLTSKVSLMKVNESFVQCNIGMKGVNNSHK